MGRVAIAAAILINLTIRLILIAQSPELSYEGFQTLLQVQNIVETGTPLFDNPNAWGGATYFFMPLFYYILAFFTIFIPIEAVVKVLPNVMISLIPIPVYLITKQITKTKGAAETVTLGSAFIPLIFVNTLTPNALSLAIPLLFLSYYFFIRLGKTPKDQIAFVITTITLAITHPISLILIPAMLLTLLLTQVQKTKFSIAMAEATMFTSFLVIWANLIVYKQTIQDYGSRIFMILAQNQQMGISEAATLIGVIPLFAGAYAALHYLTKERNEAAHATVALGLTTILLVIANVIDIITGILILSIVLIILTAGSIQLYREGKRRSRMPKLYSVSYFIIIVFFIVTNVTPAVSLGLKTLNDTPGEREITAMQILEQRLPKGANVLWDQEKGYFLQASKFSTPMTTNLLASPESERTVEELTNLDRVSQIHLLETLNEYGVDAIVLESNHSLPISDRCFESIFKESLEAYRVRCVVR